ncbi:hypothetical protein U1E44_00365 [Arenibacter sp. GZD96]|uniref:hypothetical protein n=1 Tax=Aurantibrevibacter litoralis TaxID=3106030 RepID=UPI002AFE0E57|nr:hypothetical protein [Arenibacter sp. GZD-96]MEA1784532.1 hypothetical protein [Arenibacter sp. GZD-96]
MTVNFSNSSELLVHAQQSNMYEKLLAQLQKDFHLANIAIDLQSKTDAQYVSPHILKTVLHEKIYRLILERFTEYLNLLYIIDVPESAVKNSAVEDVVEVAARVSFLILKREWQKVWFRATYS